MIEKQVTVSNRLGLHARAAAMLVQQVQNFDCHIALVNRGKEVNAKSIMGVMMLAAGRGTELTVRADGHDEARAVDAAVELFARNFDEGE